MVDIPTAFVILVVDGNPESAAAMGKLLRGLGYEQILTVGDAGAAVSSLRDTTIDLALINDEIDRYAVRAARLREFGRNR
jgi:CheY-like chemotaxis protein